MRGDEVPESAWQRVHWLTPLLELWRLILAAVLSMMIINVELLAPSNWLGGGGGLTRLGIPLAASVGGIALFLGTYVFFAWRVRGYSLTDEAVWNRHGILFKQVKHVPLERIQAVDVVQPLLGRVFGLGRLTVEAAGGTGSSIQIGLLTRSEIDRLRADILARAAGIHAAGIHAAGTTTRTESPAGQEHSVGTIDRAKDAPRPSHEEGSLTAAPEAPERVLYRVPTGRLVGAGLTSSMFMWLAVLVIAMIAVVAVLYLKVGPAAYTLLIPALLPLVMVGLPLVWSWVADDFGFTAATSPDGIRVRSGLLKTRAETIPPGRVHAVSITQPLLWRLLGWYRVQITQATGRLDPSNTATNTLLPVGTKEEAMLAAWLVIPDLGVEDPERFFNQMVDGVGRQAPFIPIPKQAMLLDPLVYSRRSVALTKTCVVSRDGFLTRSSVLVPYSRVQSMVVEAGPIVNSLRLANITTCTVRGVVSQTVPHLSREDAACVMEDVRLLSQKGRAAEPPDRWLSRVLQAAPGPAASEEVPHQPQAGPIAPAMSQGTIDFRPPRKEQHDE